MKKWVIFFIFMASLSVFAQSPPLLITNLVFSPQNVQVGDELNLTVTIVNKDFKNDYTATLKLLVDDALSDVKVTSIEARSALTASFVWKAEEGTHRLRIYLSYFAPNEFFEKRDITISVNAPQKENPLEEALTLFNARQYSQAREKFVVAKQVFENENNTEGASESDKYIALCNNYISAENALSSAQKSQEAGDFEDATRYFSEARRIYEQLGETTIVSQIDTTLSQIEKKKESPSFISDRQLLLYAGVVLLVVIVIFIYVKSREKTQGKNPHPRFLTTKLERAPREDKLVFFDEGEKGASFIARCRKILEADIPDSQAYMKIAEEFRKLQEDISSLKPEEAESVRKSYDMCAQKIASEEKKWTSICELENLLRRCDSFIAKYSNKSLLDKSMVEAYNLYTTMQDKFEELRGYDAELEKRTAEVLKKCYYLIEDEIHKTRE